LKRLQAALEEADRVTRRISKIMQDAEDEAAQILRLVGAAGFSAAAGAAIAGAIDGSNGGSGGSGSGNLLVRDPNELFKDNYMKGLIGSNFQGTGSELGKAMDGLLKNPTGDELDEFLESIANLRGRPVGEIREEFEKFQELAEQRDAADAKPVPGLSSAHPSFQGSNTQMRYGSVVGDAFGIDPVFGAMLNPTGGLVGIGNYAIAGDDTAVGYHGVVHDAAGYLHTYHGAGPSYDYLGQEARDPSSPLSGQRSGIAYWREATGGPSPISAPAEWVMHGVVGGVDAGSWAWDKATSIF
jgi:hypothetical protein